MEGAVIDMQSAEVGHKMGDQSRLAGGKSSEVKMEAGCGSVETGATE